MFPNLHQRDNKPQYKTTASPDIVYYCNIARYMNLYKLYGFSHMNETFSHLTHLALSFLNF